MTIERITAPSLVALALNFLITTAVAGEYDFETGLSYGKSSTDTEFPMLFSGSETFGTSTSSSDTDRVELSGTWYYSGLSDKAGPKSRAAFLDRASGVRLVYSYDDLSSSFASTGVSSPPAPFQIPPSSGSSDGTAHSLEVGLRHVWKSSGWYVLAGAKSANSEIDSVFNGTGGSFDIDVSAYTVGVGKYLGQGTALDLSAIATDLDGYDVMAYALSFSHIGSLTGNWYYGADLGISTSDDGDGQESYLLGLSLFPTTEVEFGIEFVHHEGPYDGELNTYGGFVSWFVRDQIELHARYQVDDRKLNLNFAGDIDSDQFTVGVNLRF